jgi:lysophospholipase L1-like esterase
MVAIMLGTNDLKVRFGLPACDIAAGAGVLVDIARASACGPGGTAPRILLIAPPPVSTLSDFAEAFEGAEEKSARFGSLYESVARSRGVEFLDAGTVVSSSTIDGIHLEVDQQRALGKAVATVSARVL